MAVVVLLGELSDPAQNGLSDHIDGGEFFFHDGESVLKILVCGKDRTKQILDKGHHVFRSLVPTLLRSAERIVVKVLIFGDFRFQ